MKDSSPYDQFKIIVYGYQDAKLESISGLEVHEVCGFNNSRWSFFSKFKNCWVLFVDKDCTLKEKTAKTLQNVVSNLDKNVVYTGYYESEFGAPSHITSYNLVCNHWYNIGVSQNDPRLLGGCFLIYCSEKLVSSEFQQRVNSIPKWGAEDYHLSIFLKSFGFQISPLNFLYVLHRPDFSVLKFFRRAFLHGFNRPKESSSKQLHFSSWIELLKKVDLFSQFFILLHLATVSAGMFVDKALISIQKPFHKNKLLKLKQ